MRATRVCNNYLTRPMTDKPDYLTVKVACLDGDRFFTLKLYDDYKSSLIMDSLVKSYSKTSLKSVTEYVKTMIQLFVVDSDSLLKSLAQESEEDRRLVLYSYYNAIVPYYVQFSLDKFVNKLNEQVFKKYPHKKPKIPTDVFDRGLGPLDILGDMESRMWEMTQKKEAMPKKKANGRQVNTKEDLLKLKRYLKDHIIGQDQAIDSLVNATKLICTDFADRATFFFLGPTGVGKTQLSKLFAEKYCGRHFKIDCGEYANGHEFNKLIGSPPGYVGHSDTNILKTKSQESNTWVFIFDEIEKASPKLFDLLLSWIETGYVTDNTGNELDFSKSIFIFTSNVGIRDAKTGKGVGFSNEERTYESSREEIEKEMERTFSPEFRNRIDFTVFFNQLDRKDAEKIAFLELENNIPIVITQEIINFVVDNGFSAKYGARQLQRFIKKSIALKVADAQLEELIPVSGIYYDAEVRDNELFIINTENYNEHNSETQKTTRGSSKGSRSSKASKGSGKAPTRRRRKAKEDSKEEK